MRTAARDGVNGGPRRLLAGRNNRIIRQLITLYYLDYRSAAAADCDGRVRGLDMPGDSDKKLWRILQLKFTLPTSEPVRFAAFLKAAKPYYELFGGRQVRLLQNVDHPAQFIQIVDYEVNASVETSRQQIAGDPRLQAFLQAWRSMFPGTVEIDIFREVEE
jgi:hypothetical protein